MSVSGHQSLLPGSQRRLPLLQQEKGGNPPAAGYIVFGAGGALWVLFAGRIIDGLTAGSIGTIYAFVADYYQPAERGRVYGFLGAVGGLGFMLGPVAGGLIGSMSPVVPLFAAAAVTPVSAAWVFFALPESASRERVPIRSPSS